MSPKNIRPNGHEKVTRYRVGADCTAVEFFARIMPGKSRTSLKQMLSKGLITRGGKVVKRLDTQLLAGDVIEQHAKPLPQFEMPSGVRVVYEDQWIIVIDKAAGLLTMSTEREARRTAYAYVSSYLKFYDSAAKVFIVHRLDRETSGLLVLAKSEQVQQALQSRWNDEAHERRYMAVVEGVPAERSATIKTHIIEHPKSLKMSVCGDDEGQEAITHYHVLKDNGRYALMDIELSTGRKNQIRVHMQHLGHPIAGDAKYGARSNPAGRLCLHAYKLELQHPILQKTLIFESPTPRELSSIVEQQSK